MTYIVYRGGKKYTITNVELADCPKDKDLFSDRETLLILKESDLFNLLLTTRLTVTTTLQDEFSMQEDTGEIFFDTKTIQ